MLDSVHASIAGFVQLMTWPTPAYMFLGVMVGYVVGVLPGLGAPAALAFLLPLVVPIAPIDGLVLLTSTSAVAASAGDITSILLGVPGEATAAAIVTDGHSLTRRGEGRYATGAALTASLMGAVVGVAVLVAVIPVAPRVITSLGSPELAALAIVGLCLLVPLSQSDPIKGLLSGAFGLALATIGLDPLHAQPRFTFSQVTLWDGLGVLPVALGIFAVAEALDMIGHSGLEAGAMTGARGIIRGAREAIRRVGLVGRCGAIGATIGSLPGVGAAVTQWIAYAHAAQSSPERQRFGHGAIDGVIGPASATTATHGGAMIPTLALGIPGGLASSFLLSALVIKGISPGPAMLSPTGHLPLVFALVWCTVIATAVGALVGFSSLGWVTRLAAIQPKRLFPVILTFILVGTVGERHATADLIILLALGVLGYVLSAAKWPRAPLMLGFVLGPLIEERVLLSNTLYGWSWVLRPTVLLLGAVVTLLLVTSLRAAGRGRGRRESGSRTPLADVMMSAGFAAIATTGLILSASLVGRSGFFPRIAFGVMLALSIVQLLVSLRRALNDEAIGMSAAIADGVARIGWLLGFVGASWLCGLVVGTVVSLFIYLRWGARERWRFTLLMTGAIGALTWLILVEVLQVSDRGLF